MEFGIYLLGVILLSACFPLLKSLFGDGIVFVAVVVACLLLIRLLGYGFRRYVESRTHVDKQSDNL